MKLNTLLLTSAATLMATSVAFAADLPSKKAAPSSGSVQVCKVAGMTGFTVPGSDTCLQIGGFVAVAVGNGDIDGDDWFGNGNAGMDYGIADTSGKAHGIGGGVGYRLHFDARSNSEMGVIRSFLQFTGGTDQDHDDDGSSAEIISNQHKTTIRRAFIQIGGFTTGLKGSIAASPATEGWYYASGWDSSAVGMDYTIALGDMSLAIGVEDSRKTNDQYTSERPDFVATLSGKSGNVNFAVSGVSHEEGGENGYALLGTADMKVGGAKLYGFAGMASNASAYLGGSPDLYLSPDLTEVGDAYSFGGGVTFAVSKPLSLTVQGVHYEDETSELNSFGFYASYELAKNLHVNPEIVYTDYSSSYFSDADVTAAYVRIQRDF